MDEILMPYILLPFPTPATAKNHGFGGQSFNANQIRNSQFLSHILIFTFENTFVKSLGIFLF